jgi:hypothetical protein
MPSPSYQRTQVFSAATILFPSTTTRRADRDRIVRGRRIAAANGGDAY